MTKIALLIAAVLLVGCGPSIPEPASSSLEYTYENAVRWELSANENVYEFSPQSDPSSTCVFVAGYRRGGLQCWRIK